MFIYPPGRYNITFEYKIESNVTRTYTVTPFSGITTNETGRITTYLFTIEVDLRHGQHYYIYLDRNLFMVRLANETNPNVWNTQDTVNSATYRRNYIENILEREGIRLITNVEDMQNAVSFFDKGQEFFNRDDFDSAIIEFSEAIRLDPHNMEYFEWRGNAYIRTNNYLMGIEDYDQAILLEPNASRFYNRGVAYFRLDEIPQAIENFEMALQYDPNHTNSRNALETIRQR